MLVLVGGLQGGLVLGGNMETTPDKPLLNIVLTTVVKQALRPLMTRPLGPTVDRGIHLQMEITDEIIKAPAARSRGSVEQHTCGRMEILLAPSIAPSAISIRNANE